MKINNHKLPEHALGGQRQLTSFHFGQQGSGEKIYLQAGLHADELLMACWYYIILKDY